MTLIPITTAIIWHQSTLDHDQLWNILRDMGLPDYLTCFLRNLYAGQEATVRTLNGTTKWLKIEKAIQQAAYCHSAYLTSM